MNNIKNISIVCPTLNEEKNVAVLYEKIKSIVKFPWELIFVDDDSKDQTRLNIQKICRKDPRVKFINRIGRKGLSSAVAEGILCSIYDWCVIIDADLQHDINNINKMILHANKNNIDIVISSRLINSKNKGLSRNRAKISQAGNRLINLILKKKLNDPLSGCFLIRKSSYELLHKTLILSGFKILFDILSSPLAKNLKVSEIPITFLPRHAGDSKLQHSIILEFLGACAVRLVEKIFPIIFLKFCLIGILGVLFHYLIFGL